jgi:CheY-like chemotaxis protein
VVDDHLESRLLLRQLLEPVGFKVLEAAGGQEACDMCRKNPPHLVWMDIRMPGMDGYEAARRIREAERARHTPIIAFTAGVMEEQDSSPLAGVFDDWVYKPFREEAVFAKLEQHLGVRFLHAAAGSPAARQAARKDREELTVAEVAQLPAEWLDQFSRKLKTGWTREILMLIDQLHPAEENMARLLGDLVRAHEFERLIPLFEEAIKEKANG